MNRAPGMNSLSERSEFSGGSFSKCHSGDEFPTILKSVFSRNHFSGNKKVSCEILNWSDED